MPPLAPHTFLADPAMFDRLGSLVARHWVVVLLAWLVVVVGIRLAAPRWSDVTYDGDFAYLPADMTSVQGERLLEAAFSGEAAKSQVVIVLARPDGPLAAADYGVADRLAGTLTPAEDADTPVIDILSFRTPVIGQKLVTEPGPQGQAMLVILQLRTEFMAIGNWDLMREVYGAIDAAREDKTFPTGLELGVTGSAAIGHDMLAAAEQSIHNTEWTTVALVVLILLMVYRAPGLVLVPLVTIGVSVAVATSLVAMVTAWAADVSWFDFKIFKTTHIFVVVILFGAGVDYCLFLISRYKEELLRGLARRDAIARSLGKVGDALAASALTTIVGLGMMALADFGKFRNSGPAIAVCLLVALAAAMTLAPALLRATGRVVFWPWGVGPKTSAATGKPPEPDDETAAAGGSLFRGFWEQLSRLVIARPGTILVGSVVVLSPLVYQGLNFDVTYDLLRELGSDRPSVRGTELLARHFPPGETGPVTLLVYDAAGEFRDKDARREKIRRLHEDLHRFGHRDPDRPPEITRVRSLHEPLGDEPEKVGFFGTLRGELTRSHPKSKDTYLSQAPGYEGKVARFDLVFRHDPFSVQSIHLLDELEGHLRDLARDPASPWHGTKVYVVGTTAGIRDLRAVTARDRSLIQIVVPLAVLAVLVVILRRPLVSVYLIVSVLFGYFVTIGTTELVFAWAYGDSFHGLDWKVPIFLFVILIAVGQDYNVYLVTRVFEEQRRRGPIEGLRVALVRTGGIITSCGIIMAGTFASMTTGSLRAMHELGFALSMGVLLDTLVIRTILVPAFLVLWERRFPNAAAADESPEAGSPPESEVPGDSAEQALVGIPPDGASADEN